MSDIAFGDMSNPDNRIDEHLIMLVKDGEGPHDFFVECKCGERFVLWRDHSENIDIPLNPANHYYSSRAETQS